MSSTAAAPSMTDIFGPVISTYTRAQAIEDGTLVDVSEAMAEGGVRFPVAMTREAYENVVGWNNANRAAGQDESGRLWDVVTMMTRAMRRARGSVISFSVYRVPNTPRATKPRLQLLRATCGPGDCAAPVITIKLG